MIKRRGLDWPARSRQLTTALYFLVLTWSMLAPGSTFDEIEDFLPHQDKIVHGASFLTLAFLVRWALAAREGGCWRLRGSFALVLLYAGAIEALQPVLGGAGRQFDWLDMASNFAGVCAGWAARVNVPCQQSDVGAS